MLLKIGILLVVVIAGIECAGPTVQGQIESAENSHSNILSLGLLTITPDDIFTIVDALKKNNQIDTLDLTGSNVGDANSAVLFSLLKNTNVKNLLMGSNGLTSLSLNMLQNELPYVPLDKLDLSNNNFDDDGIINFMKFLKNTNITELEFQSNNVNDNIVAVLVNALKETKLNKLNLDQNEITDDIFAIPFVETLIQSNIDCSLNYNSHLGTGAITKIIDDYQLNDKTKFILKGHSIGFKESVAIARTLFLAMKIDYVDLSDNSLEFDDISVISSALRHSNVQTLILNNNNIDLDVLNTFRYQVTSQSSINFIELNLNAYLSIDPPQMVDFFNMLNFEQFILRIHGPFTEADGDKIAERLTNTQINSLTLDIASVDVKENEMKALAKVLSNLQLFALKITHARNFRSESIETLMNLLTIRSNVYDLSLDGNNINIIGILNLAKKIKNTNVTSLNLDNNQWELNSSLDELLKGLIGSKVKTLSLKNIFIKSAPFDARSIANHLRSTPIRSLNLANNEIKANEIRTIARSLSNTKVEELYLNNNDIKSEGVTALAGVLKDTHISTLNLEGNDIDNVGAKSIADVLCETKIVNLNINRNDKITEQSNLDKIDQCLESNRVKVGYQKPEVIGVRSKLNRIEMSHTPATVGAALDSSLPLVVGIATKLNLTNFMISSINPGKELHVNAIKDIVKVNKVFFSPTLYQEPSTFKGILESNYQLFLQAKKVVKKYKDHLIKDCTDSDFHAYDLFESTVDLYENEVEVDALKLQIRREIDQIREKKRQIELAVKRANNLMLQFTGYYTFVKSLNL